MNEPKEDPFLDIVRRLACAANGGELAAVFEVARSLDDIQRASLACWLRRRGGWGFQKWVNETLRSPEKIAWLEAQEELVPKDVREREAHRAMQMETSIPPEEEHVLLVVQRMWEEEEKPGAHTNAAVVLRVLKGVREGYENLRRLLLIISYDPATLARWPDVALRELWDLVHEEGHEEAALGLHYSILAKDNVGAALLRAGCQSSSERRNRAFKKVLLSSCQEQRDGELGWEGMPLGGGRYVRDVWQLHPEKFRLNWDGVDPLDLLQKSSWAMLRFLVRTQDVTPLAGALKQIAWVTNADEIAARLLRLALSRHVPGMERQVAEGGQAIVALLRENGVPDGEVWRQNRWITKGFLGGFNYQMRQRMWEACNVSQLWLFMADIVSDAPIPVGSEVVDAILEAWPETGVLLGLQNDRSFDFESWERDHLHRIYGQTRRRWYWHKAVGVYQAVARNAGEELHFLVDLPPGEVAGDGYGRKLVRVCMPYLEEVLLQYPRLVDLLDPALDYLVGTGAWKLNNADIAKMPQKEVIRTLLRACCRCLGVEDLDIHAGFMAWLRLEAHDLLEPYGVRDLPVENIPPVCEESANIPNISTHHLLGLNEELRSRALWQPMKEENISLEVRRSNREAEAMAVRFEPEEQGRYRNNWQVDIPLVVAGMPGKLSADLVRRMEHPLTEALAVSALSFYRQRGVACDVLRDLEGVLRYMARRIADGEARAEGRHVSLEERERVLEKLRSNTGYCVRQFEECLGYITDAWQEAPELFTSEMSFRRRMEVGERWHRDLVEAPLDRAIERAWDTYQRFPETFFPGYCDEHVQIIRLEDSLDLAREGKAQNHCVGGHAKICGRAQSFVYSIRTATGHRVATLALTRTGGIDSLLGEGNSRLPRTRQNELEVLIKTLVLDAKVRAWVFQCANDRAHQGSVNEPVHAICRYIHTAVQAGILLEEIARELEERVGDQWKKSALSWLASVGRTRSSAKDRRWLLKRESFLGHVGDVRRRVAAQAIESLEQGKTLEEVHEAVARMLGDDAFILDPLLVAHATPRDLTSDFGQKLLGQDERLARIAQGCPDERGALLLRQYTPVKISKQESERVLKDAQEALEWVTALFSGAQEIA